jgi:ureidoglycolate lyase
MPVVVPRPLVRSAFAPFGEVLEIEDDGFQVNEGHGTYHAIQWELESLEAGARLDLAMFRLVPRPHPVVIRQLERHPYSSQAFLPMDGRPSLVVVAPARDDGRPDVAAAQAFFGRPDQGLIYRPSVWHAGLTTLEAAGTFAMLIWRGRRAHSEVFQLDDPLRIGT